jgi:hypothetical protein
MMRTSYAAFFTVAVFALCAGCIAAFRHIEAQNRAQAYNVVAWPADSLAALQRFHPIATQPADYARFAAEDAEWRQRYAREYTLTELRTRGDGRRTPQQALQDRVYELNRRGERRAAIAELEQWVARNPGDEDALLWLARMLNESGRSEDAVARYRQILTARSGSQ